MKKMSPLGAALFSMMADMGMAQVTIYSRGGAPEEAQAEVERLRALHQPTILNTINRPSKGESHVR